MSYETAPRLAERRDRGRVVAGPHSAAAYAAETRSRYDVRDTGARAVADVMHYARASGQDPFAVVDEGRRLYMRDMDALDREPIMPLQPWPPEGGEDNVA